MTSASLRLERRGLTVERQVVVPVLYKGKRLATELRVDLIVVGRVVVECKAVSTYNRVFAAQVLTYLRQLDQRLFEVILRGEHTTRLRQPEPELTSPVRLDEINWFRRFDNVAMNLGRIVGTSPALRRMLKRVEAVAKRETQRGPMATVLLDDSTASLDKNAPASSTDPRSSGYHHPCGTRTWPSFIESWTSIFMSTWPCSVSSRAQSSSPREPWSTTSSSAPSVVWRFSYQSGHSRSSTKRSPWRSARRRRRVCEPDCR